MKGCWGKSFLCFIYSLLIHPLTLTHISSQQTLIMFKQNKQVYWQKKLSISTRFIHAKKFGPRIRISNLFLLIIINMIKLLYFDFGLSSKSPSCFFFLYPLLIQVLYYFWNRKSYNKSLRVHDCILTFFIWIRLFNGMRKAYLERKKENNDHVSVRK